MISSGWTFSDAGVTAKIPNGVILNAGEYVVFTDNEPFANALEYGIYLSNFPSLNDSGDELVIRNTSGITIDSLFYTSDWGGYAWFFDGAKRSTCCFLR